MDIVAAGLRVCIVLFMVCSLGAAGLGVSPRAALAPIQNARFVLLTLIGGWMMGPAIAVLLVAVLPLEPPYALGLLLLALAPCAPFAPPLMRAAGGAPAYIAGFMLLSTVATVILMPVGVPLLVPGLAVSPATIARPLVLFVLAPLLAGMLVRGLRPAAADRLLPPISALMRATAAGMLVLLALIHGRGIVDAVGSYAIAAQICFVAATTLAAAVLGSGLPGGQRTVLTLGLGTRNLGAALAPLGAIDADPHAIVMIAIAVPVTIAASAITARILARHVIAPRVGHAGSA